MSRVSYVRTPRLSLEEWAPGTQKRVTLAGADEKRRRRQQIKPRVNILLSTNSSLNQSINQLQNFEQRLLLNPVKERLTIKNISPKQ